MYETFGGEQAPLGEHLWAYQRYLIMKLTGWTYQYIDTLDHATVTELFSISAALDKTRKQRRQK